MLDAAVEIVGTGGLRRLTYQAVDTAADVPNGTTSNHFRSRDLLVAGVVAHLEALDARDWEHFAALPSPGDPDALTETLASLVHHALGPARHRTAARYTLVLEALARPAIRDPLARAQESLLTLMSPWLEALGSTSPAAHGRTLFDYLDGLILHQMTLPAENFDPAPGIRTVLAAALPPAA
ncbi:TetR family transcriptional regulator [Streptomyces albiaxialis]|uniref:TetR family transcriptional regulator n=1 Tax=Streptomyces albiaxialis TaxID=329523 RepID=A0ABN2W4W6_9ACTN